jgi:hypothetical protein
LISPETSDEQFLECSRCGLRGSKGKLAYQIDETNQQGILRDSRGCK